MRSVELRHLLLLVYLILDLLMVAALRRGLMVIFLVQIWQCGEALIQERAFLLHQYWLLYNRQGVILNYHFLRLGNLEQIRAKRGFLRLNEVRNRSQIMSFISLRYFTEAGRWT